MKNRKFWNWIGFEPESGYHHYTVDVAQYYEYETEER